MPRPPLARWLGILLRGVHLSAVIYLGAALLADRPATAAAAAVLASGVALFALDTWSYPGHLFEVAGASVAVKLVLVAAMAIDSGLRMPLFWVIIFWSVLFSHAPARLRHRRLGRRADPAG